MATISKVTQSQFQEQCWRPSDRYWSTFTPTGVVPVRFRRPSWKRWPVTRVKKLDVVKVDVDTEADLAQTYGVRSIPTLVLFKDGKAVEARVGVNSQAQTKPTGRSAQLKTVGPGSVIPLAGLIYRQPCKEATCPIPARFAS